MMTSLRQPGREKQITSHHQSGKILEGFKKINKEDIQTAQRDICNKMNGGILLDTTYKLKNSEIREFKLPNPDDDIQDMDETIYGRCDRRYLQTFRRNEIVVQESRLD